MVHLVIYSHLNSTQVQECLRVQHVVVELLVLIWLQPQKKLTQQLFSVAGVKGWGDTTPRTSYLGQKSYIWGAI